MSFGWRVHDDAAVLPAALEVDEFDAAEAKFVVPKIKIFRPSKASFESIDWVVAELTATVSLVERWRSLASSLAFLTKKPSGASVYAVAVAQQHLMAVSDIAAQWSYKKVAYSRFLHVRSELLPQLFIDSWAFFNGKNKDRALKDLKFVLDPAPRSEKELFDRAKLQDSKGAGYGMKNVTEFNQLRDAKKSKDVHAVVFAMINYFNRTRMAYIGNLDFEKAPDQAQKKACKIALRQASLYVLHFASAIREASNPEQAEETFSLLDELNEVTHDLSLEMSNLTGRPEGIVTGGYQGPGSYTSEGFDWKKDQEEADKAAQRFLYDFAPRGDTDTYESVRKLLVPYAQGGTVVDGVKIFF